jgi:hypothetical protein
MASTLGRTLSPVVGDLFAGLFGDELFSLAKWVTRGPTRTQIMQDLTCITFRHGTPVPNCTTLGESPRRWRQLKQQVTPVTAKAMGSCGPGD